MVKIGNIEKIAPLMCQWSKWYLELEMPTNEVMYLSLYTCVGDGQRLLSSMQQDIYYEIKFFDTLGFDTNVACIVSMDHAVVTFTS